MEFREILKRRRIVRSYRPDPIDGEVIERIAGLIRKVPTAGHAQGLRIIVVTDARMRQRLVDAMGGEDDDLAAGREPWISVAPVHLVVLVREADYHERYRMADKLEATGGEEIEWPAPYWYVDAGALIMLLLLAAIDEGLAAGFFGAVGEQEIRLRELLGVPPDMALIGVVTVGKPAPDPNWSAVSSLRTRPRKEIAELVRWEHWTSR